MLDPSPANSELWIITLVDARSEEIVGTVPLTGEVRTVRLSPDGTVGYVADRGACVSVSACDGTAAVVVFDTATYGVIATIPIGPAAMSARRDVAVDPQGRFVYATAYGESLVVIDAGTNAIASRVPVVCCFGSITVNPDGLRASLSGSAFFTDCVDVITLPGGEPLGSVTFEFESIGRRVATTADGTTAFVGLTECLRDRCARTIAVIDTQALTVTALTSAANGWTAYKAAVSGVRVAPPRIEPSSPHPARTIAIAQAITVTRCR
jgi:DNA-binding beta-propeller fold protein YncE